MLRSLNTAISGLQQSQQEINVVGNNIANVNTTAFKNARTDFEDSFSQALAGNKGQVGSGVNMAAISNNFNQGAISRTEVGTDLAVSGQGFFMVRNTIDNSQCATRAGAFHLDTAGYLVDNDGLRVQGFSDAGLSARGDLLVDATGAPATTAAGASVQSFSIDQTGSINVKMSDGTTFVRGQVLLQSFRDPSQLVKEGGNRYSGTAAAGPLAQTSAPQSNGLGLIESGALEMSNVDLTTEMSNLIVAQRAFQANARIITTSDEVLQEVVNLKR
jgi:flagellar hook protein FlgE